MLSTGRDGFIAEKTAQGFFVDETRLLSMYRFLIDGERPHPVALSNVEQHSWLGYYIHLPRELGGGARDAGSGQMGEESQQTLELRLSRYVGLGFHEDVDLTNFTQQLVAFRLDLECDADFADQAEAEGERQQQGRIRRRWRQAENSIWELTFDYRVDHQYDHQGTKGRSELHRGVALRIRNAGSEPVHARKRIGFRIELAPQATWHACVDVVPAADGATGAPLYGCRSFAGTDTQYDRRRTIFLSEATGFTSDDSSTLSSTVIGALDQAKLDLAALRLYDLDHSERAWTMAAGLPIYIALFGRDTLTAAWQAALLGPGMMHGTLLELAKWQGTETNDWRDEQPGRMLHEAHTGPLEILNFNPRARYYGSITTSAFYPVIAAELWHWTGDKDLVRPLIKPALSAIHWLDTYADSDGDGFYEYRTRSGQGVTNQGWKDSGDAMVYEDGSQVQAPIGTCEEQGFVYQAKLLLSEVLWWLDEKEEAQRLYHQASELKKRFNDAYWMADDGFVAMALDAKKRQLRSVSSNPGHCLATAIVDESLVRQTADRLMADDLFTGWGVRTLSSTHPAYNPYSYHRGSVWPVENATFALGFMRYGLHDHLERICRAQFEAAALFDFYRLPELFSGHPRDEDHPFPALYPKANSPQAWSASAVICLVQALLGLYPYAPLNMLLVDPHLPEWLPELTLHNLRVGHAAVTIRFYRTKSGASDYEVLDTRGPLHLLRQPSPWSMTAGFAERAKDALLSLLPGR